MAITYTAGYTFKTGEDVSADILPKKLNAALTGFTFTAINGIPIGNTSPSTGAFTTLSTTTVINAPDGNAGGPGYSFTTDSDSGIYRIGANDIAFGVGGGSAYLRTAVGSVKIGVGGADIVTVTATAIAAPDGNTGGPAYSFSSDSDSGVFRAAANDISMSVGGGSAYLRTVVGSVRMGVGGADVLTATATGFTIAAGVALQLGSTYAAGVVAPTGTVTIKDATGTSYRVACAL